jgi:DNA-binding NarL/FixJ family response regulator
VISVLVAAPSGVVRAGLARLLDGRKTLRVVVGAPGRALREQIEDARPDVLLVDTGAERVTAWLRTLGSARLPPAIVLLTDDARGSLGAEALSAGVRAVLPRHASPEEIVVAIEGAATGLVVVHPDSLTALPRITSSSRPAAAAIAHEPLTPREIEVLGMMAEGLGNKLIAARLKISEHTVKFHIASIFAKLNAGSRTEAVTIGLRQGLIMI